MFANFGTNRPLEEISQELCKILDSYRCENNDDNIDKIKYNEQIFEVITTYTYSEDSYVSIDLIDNDNAIDELLIPYVSGISLYVLPQPKENGLKQQLITAFSFLETIYNRLITHYVDAKGFFLYIATTSNEVKSNIRSHIEQKMKRIDERIKFIPSRENELKILLNALVAARIGETLTIKI